MRLEDLFQIQHKFRKRHITPIILDYYIEKSNLYNKTFNEENLHRLTVCKLNVKYMEEKGYK